MLALASSFVRESPSELHDVRDQKHGAPDTVCGRKRERMVAIILNVMATYAAHGFVSLGRRRPTTMCAFCMRGIWLSSEVCLPINLNRIMTP